MTSQFIRSSFCFEHEWVYCCDIFSEVTAEDVGTYMCELVVEGESIAVIYEVEVTGEYIWALFTSFLTEFCSSFNYASGVWTVCWHQILTSEVSSPFLTCRHAMLSFVSTMLPFNISLCPSNIQMPLWIIVIVQWTPHRHCDYSLQ